MASLGYIDSLLSGLDQNTRRIVAKALEHIVQNLKFGVPTEATRTRNFGMGYLTATTPSVPDREFAVPHTIGSRPYLCIPVLPVGETGAKVVSLTVTRPADERYIYLSSPEVDTDIWLLVEG